MSGSETGSVTLVQAIRSNVLLVILVGLGTAVLIAAFTWFTTPAATARSQLGLVSPATGNVLLPLPAGDATMARYTAQRALFAESDEVLRRVVDAIPGTTLDDLRASITVVPSKNANAILITTSAQSPEQAVTLAQAVTDAYREATAQDVTTRTEALAEGYEARGDQRQAEQARIDGRSFGDGVEFEVSADAATVQARKLLTKETALGLLVGLGIGALVAWSREDSKRRRRLISGGPPR